VTGRAWFELLYDAEQMRAIDAWAIGARGVPSLELMERAGAGVAEEAERIAPDGVIAVFAGRGNNGGDGLVAARLLRRRGRDVNVLLACDPDELRGDARANLERLPGEPPTRLSGTALDGPVPSLAVDALLGTGATGEPRGAIADAIRAIEQAAAPVLAVDVPSGVDASTGEAASIVVRAVATVTFHAAKPGLWIEPGRGQAGRVRVLDIEIPEGAAVEARTGLVHDGVIDVIPVRGVHSTKFTSGRVLVAGGSTGLTGAPSMVAMAAARAGAGYVTVCVPATLSPIFEARLLEPMTLALADEAGEHTAAGVDAVVAAARERGGALVLGPGLGSGEHAAAFARGVLEQAGVPTVLDADGLRAFAGSPEALAGRATVITPHEGELGRLFGRPSAAIAAARLRSAREAAARSGAVVVLKGDDTIVAQPDGLAGVSPGATPGLATAGTGDVLAGVIGAMLASGLDSFTAALAGVRLHALAAVHAANRHGVQGMIASDVIEALPAVRG
jgi:NAD(P)H-hydrate epimerase